MNARNTGFSLVELSIVLVILGLLTGGILGGQALIHAAELRKVTTEYQAIQTSVNTFRNKYNALPGDFGKAQQFWGAGTCSTAMDLSTTTCRGDNNGIIENSIVGGQATLEPYMFWHHLSKAGLDAGQYNEFMDLYSKTSNSGMGGWSMPGVWISPQSHPMYFFSSVKASNNYLLMVDYEALLAGHLQMQAEDAWQIDQKIDDGKPGTGAATVIVGLSSGGEVPECAVLSGGGTPDSDDGVTAEYDLQQTTPACVLVLPLQ